MGCWTHSPPRFTARGNRSPPQVSFHRQLAVCETAHLIKFIKPLVRNFPRRVTPLSSFLEIFAHRGSFNTPLSTTDMYYMPVIFFPFY